MKSLFTRIEGRWKWMKLDGKTYRLGSNSYGLTVLSEGRAPRDQEGKAPFERLAREILRVRPSWGASRGSLDRFVFPVPFLPAWPDYPAECGVCGARGCSNCLRGADGLLVHPLLWIEGVLVRRQALQGWMHELPDRILLGAVEVTFPRLSTALNHPPDLRPCLLLDGGTWRAIVAGLDPKLAHPETPRWTKQLALVDLPPGPSPRLRAPRGPANDTATPDDDSQPNLEDL